MTGRVGAGTSVFASIAVAILKGFVRDRQAVFFAVIFPLMFLMLFGVVFDVDESPRVEVIAVGEVALLEELSEPAREAFAQTFDLRHSDDRAAALEEVRTGGADAVVEMPARTLVVHYTATDRVRAAIVQGALRAFVDQANVAATGRPPLFEMRTEQVEDESITLIQFMTPGLLGWAVAMSAAFGAAATLQGWRSTKLLRRLQLSPASTGSVVAARVVVTVVVALVQMAIFLGVAVAGFGMQLSGWWWLAVPLLVAGTLAFMSLGLLAGALANTTEGAVNLANFLVLPMALMSGSFFPVEGLPGWMDTLSRLLPLRHLNDGMLDVMVRGLGPAATVEPMLVLLGFAVLVSAVAVRLFRWETT